MNSTTAVLERYTEGAKARQADLCCPVDYDTDLLKALPHEIIERDYGCGDPSRYVRPGDTVLDLGSGGGKICYMAAQLVGEHGRVIGIDMNDDMLALARKYQSHMASTLGSDRVEFQKGYIQDLALNIDAMNSWLCENPVTDTLSHQALLDWQNMQKTTQPLIEDQSIDLVVKNCRVGEDVPLATHTLEEFCNAEFNSPWEEFSLVFEMREGLFLQIGTS